jgi:hypothetical protein
MTNQVQDTQAPTQEQKQNDKEINFRKQEQLYQRMLAEREARIADLEKKTQQSPVEDDDDDSEPYVDKKKLNKTLAKFGQANDQKMGQSLEMIKERAKDELRQEMWLENNPDFYQVLQMADKFAEKAPELAKTILKMPEGFERQKLVYQNIKMMKLDQSPQKEPSIQEKIDANKKSPFYQPSNIAPGPYNQVGDFSESGMKAAHDKMMALKKQLRL